MKILLHNPDNGITGNFMPHLWMFLLHARTPPPHEVIQLDQAWTDSYDPAATRRATSKIVAAPIPYKISHLIARLCFRGIYFPQKGSLAWIKVMIENRSVILQIILDSLTKWRGSAEAEVLLDFDTGARKLAKVNLNQ